MRKLCWMEITPDGDINAQAYDKDSKLAFKVSGMMGGTKRIEISEDEVEVKERKGRKGA